MKLPIAGGRHVHAGLPRGEQRGEVVKAEKRQRALTTGGGKAPFFFACFDAAGEDLIKQAQVTPWNCPTGPKSQR